MTEQHDVRVDQGGQRGPRLTCRSPGCNGARLAPNSQTAEAVGGEELWKQALRQFLREHPSGLNQLIPDL
jgi:hypothetical protein